MSSITQLNPPLEVETPFGAALAMLVWEQGQELDVQWCCFVEVTGEPWWLPNHQIRLGRNLSAGRGATSPIKAMPCLEPHIKRTAAFSNGERS